MLRKLVSDVEYTRCSINSRDESLNRVAFIFVNRRASSRQVLEVNSHRAGNQRRVDKYETVLSCFGRSRYSFRFSFRKDRKTREREKLRNNIAPRKRVNRTPCVCSFRKRNTSGIKHDLYYPRLLTTYETTLCTERFSR